MAQIRLNKALSQAGVASRRGAEKFISDKRVMVNGKPVTSQGVMVDLDKDIITCDGKPIKLEKKYCFILNKPLHYICTSAPVKRRVIDLFSEFPVRLYTVGRLDKETTGLLIVTNDGAFSNRIIHPSSAIEKEYLVKTDKDLSSSDLKKLSQGISIDGTFIQPKSVKKIRRGTVKISVMEGKKHEVRSLIEAIGAEVLSLTRIRIGKLILGNLEEGTFRHMTEREKELIFE